MIRRRHVVAGLGAIALAGPAGAHALYRQWAVYRRKHLLIGCHRQDPASFTLATELAAWLDHDLPVAKARVARAPHPERLASLLGTDQLEIAVLDPLSAQQMAAGEGRFHPYGALPLTAIADYGGHLLIAHASMPDRHAWMLTDVIAGHAAATALPKGLDWHPGTVARRAGTRLEALPGG